MDKLILLYPFPTSRLITLFSGALAILKRWLPWQWGKIFVHAAVTGNEEMAIEVAQEIVGEYGGLLARLFIERIHRAIQLLIMSKALEIAK